MELDFPPFLRKLCWTLKRREVASSGYEPSDELSVKRKLLEEHLEAMHTVGLLARDGKPYADGYFRNMAYSLGTCSDILYGVTVLYQTNSAPKDNTLCTSLD
ncbi:hypothetical protein P8452_62461 [Trifolium repens]|nr:hypothetical protein P8452_62461 [Trifolium repens]